MQRRRLAIAALVLAASTALTGCTNAAASFAQKYPLDPRLDKLPVVAADAKFALILPADEKFNVVGTVRSSSGVSIDVAIHGGKCAIAVYGTHHDDIGAGIEAPTSESNVASDPSWKGESKTIGPFESTGTQLKPKIDISFDCGTKGAWIGIPIPAAQLKVTGAARLAPAADAGKLTGILITA